MRGGEPILITSMNPLTRTFFMKFWIIRIASDLGPEIAQSLREDLVDRVRNALRNVHHENGRLTVPIERVAAWLRCAAVLRDERLLEIVKKLGAHLSKVEQPLLTEPLEKAKRELQLRRLEDDVEVVVMAVRELRVLREN